jgi:hypothetical protein
VRITRHLAAGAGLLALIVPAAALAETGTAATLRSATARLITAELNRDGAGACGVLNTPLTTTVRGQTCAQRWDARSARLLATSGGTGRLRADLRAAASAPIAISGEHGAITLPYPLLDGHSHFYWTNNCWMLTR